jgi:hypothetical protein
VSISKSAIAMSLAIAGVLVSPAVAAKPKPKVVSAKGEYTGKSAQGKSVLLGVTAKKVLGGAVVTAPCDSSLAPQTVGATISPAAKLDGRSFSSTSKSTRRGRSGLTEITATVKGTFDRRGKKVSGTISAVEVLTVPNQAGAPPTVITCKSGTVRYSAKSPTKRKKHKTSQKQA